MSDFDEPWADERFTVLDFEEREDAPGLWFAPLEDPQGGHVAFAVCSSHPDTPEAHLALSQLVSIADVLNTATGRP